MVYMLSAIGLNAQGTVVFDNNVPGVVVTHVYWDGISPARFKVGNGPDDFPRGFQDYNGMYPFFFGYAQLFAAPGANEPWYNLRPASPITSFQQGAEAGFVKPMIAELEGVPADAPVATLQLRAWISYRETWNEAVGWGDACAVSPPFNVYNIGGEKNTPPFLVGLQSFSIANLIPEPSSVALTGLGALTFYCLARRGPRRKREGVLVAIRGSR